MEVIPYILDERAVVDLPDSLLQMLAECSTKPVMDSVIAYVNNDKADSEAKAKILTAYSRQLGIKQFLEDKAVQDIAAEVKELSYASINPSLSVEQLQEYGDNISFLLNNDNAIPYIPPIRGDVIKGVIEELKEISKTSNNQYVELFCKNIQRCTRLFKDTKKVSYRGTVVKHIVKNRSMFEVMNRGIEFLIAKKNAGESPASWRYL